MNGHENGAIMLAAGGTGGHVFPAQALAAELDRRGRAVSIVTDRRGDDFGRRFPGSTIHRINADTPSGQGPLGKLTALLRIVMGTVQARRLIKRTNPAAVVGFGGYPSLPTMLAAISASVPRIIHEQNAVLGRVNRLLAGRVDAVATSFPATKGLAQNSHVSTVTGNPVRDEVLALVRHDYRAPADDQRFQLLVFGGSQGARVFSEIIPQAICDLSAAHRRRLRVVQQCRPEDLETVSETYAKAGVGAETAAFFTDLPQRLADSHLVIARSGAGTVAELAVSGRPSILVPYVYATDDHQTCNAQVLSEAGGAWLMPQSTFKVDRLSEQLALLLDQPEQLQQASDAVRGQAHPDAAAKLADLVLAMAMPQPTRRAAA